MLPLIFFNLRIYCLFLFRDIPFLQSFGFYGLQPFGYLLHDSDSDIIVHGVYRHTAKYLPFRVRQKDGFRHLRLFRLQCKEITIQNLIQEYIFQREIMIHIFQKSLLRRFCRAGGSPIRAVNSKQIILPEQFPMVLCQQTVHSDIHDAFCLQADSSVPAAFRQCKAQ